MRKRPWSEHYFLIERSAKPTIKVEKFGYRGHEGNPDDQKNLSKICIEADHADFEIQICLPKKHLKKLIMATQKFLAEPAGR